MPVGELPVLAKWVRVGTFPCSTSVTIGDTTYSYTTGADNQLLSDGTHRYQYDAAGNRTARFVDADADGLLDAGDTNITQYTWDSSR